MLRRIARASVWARDGVRAEDWRFRGLFRFVLPATDVFFLWFGFVGWQNGIVSVQQEASPTWQTWWSAGIAVAALIALVGVAFPRLWWVELVGKIPLISLVSVYIFILFARGPLVAATGGLVCILILLPIWRVGDLGFTAWLRKADG